MKIRLGAGMRDCPVRALTRCMFNNYRRPDAQPGRFAYQDQSGWVLFEGLQNGRDVTGSAVVGERGVIGIVMGPSLTDPQISRVMPLTYISVRTRAWGHNWSLPLDGSVEATNALQAGPTRYLRSSEPDGIALSHSTR